MTELPRNAARRGWLSGRGAQLSFGAIALLAALAVVGPWLSPNAAQTLDWAHVAAPPTLAQAHWFGTDRLGRDLFVRTLEGARVSMLVALIAGTVSMSLGLVYGAIAGYAGGRTDDLMMRIIEILGGLPLIFFVIFLTVVFGRNELLLFVAIGAVGWLTLARIVRGQALGIRRQEYIEAAIAGGAGGARIIATHVLPNVIGPVIVYATLTIPQIVLLESFLSFLGLGVREPSASLGTLIAEGAGEMEAAPWMLLAPGLYLTLLLIGLNVFGDRLRDALEPGARR